VGLDSPSPFGTPVVFVGAPSACKVGGVSCGEEEVSRSISIELRMLSSRAAAMADKCRRSSSGGRLRGWESRLGAFRFDEKKLCFEAVDEDRLCEGYKSRYDREDFVGDLRGEDAAEDL
jgi:hypothetical protein